MTQAEKELVEQVVSLYQSLEPKLRKEAINRIVSTHYGLVCRLIEVMGKCTVKYYGR